MNRIVAIGAGIALPLALTACELGPKTTAQTGYRGTGMDSIRLASVARAKDTVPPPPYDNPGMAGKPAREVYQNLQVLGDVPEEQFTYTMAAITNWIAPEQGCNYCHNPANMASDEIYTKVVARRMLEMTRNINGNWSKHVGKTGVTCWTCHRGNAVPTNHWTLPAAAPGGIIGNRKGQNNPVAASAFSSLPESSLALYLTGDPTKDRPIRVVSTGMHPSPANRTSTQATEPSYALMMHVSQALGVNCSHCHNGNSFQSWSNSTPARAKAWYGIRMVRNINAGYITPLAGTFPPIRKGVNGDPFKASCATCHQGKARPMNGYPMAKDYPALWGPASATAPATPAAPANAAAPATRAR